MSNLTVVLCALLTSAPTAGAAESVLDADLAAWVDQRVRDWQPTAAEKRLDAIGWADDLRAALRLAKEHQRPVFLFTHDGRMATGRA